MLILTRRRGERVRIGEDIYVSVGFISDSQLRDILEKRYYTPCVISLSEYSYLEGLRDAEVIGARELLEALDKNEKIEIYFAN